MLKRTDHPDFWQSVTGSLAWDESPPQTARRELEEETGLVREDLVDHQRTFEFEILERWRHRFAPGVTHNLEHLFSLQISEAIDITLNPFEHSAFVWLPRDLAAKKAWSWTNRDAILQLVPS